MTEISTSNKKECVWYFFCLIYSEIEKVSSLKNMFNLKFCNYEQFSKCS